MLFANAKVRGASQLESATIRDFSGGLNTVDDDLNLDTRYAVALTNCSYTVRGSVDVRQGTRLFVDLNTITASGVFVYPINIEYFNNALIVVASSGEVFRIYGDGSATVIWPYGEWSATTFASFAQFNGELIICNGVDKPLLVNTSFDVDYLQDLATTSNVNTPICRYVIASNRYVIMAGDPVNPNRVHISARDTSGTWYGDPDPNDATYIDVGSSLKVSSVIRGIADFRGRLVVAFADGTVLGVTGIYSDDGATHLPNFDDSVEQYGAISHRGMQSYGDDLLMMDRVGVPSLKRTVFTGTIRPERVSDLVDDGMTALINSLTFVSMEERVFSIYDQNEGQFMFFIPNANTLENTTETIAYVFTYRQNLKVSAWARYTGWNWTCGCRSAEGNIFFGGKNGKLYVMGSQTSPITVDFLNDPSVNSGEGQGISFDWELPWADINTRTRIKNARYISFDTRGRAQFDVKMYIDRIRLNGSYTDTPQLQGDFYAGDILGFGDGEQAFGGGRIASDERLWYWPAKFKMMKLRFSGTVTEALSFQSISLYYLKGKYAR
jgi:hypothetical protein